MFFLSLFSYYYPLHQDSELKSDSELFQTLNLGIVFQNVRKKFLKTQFNPLPRLVVFLTFIVFKIGAIYVTYQKVRIDTLILDIIFIIIISVE